MALIAIAADKGSPGVTTAAMALATAWPRPVLLAECDPAGGDLAYRMPAEGGGRLDTQRGLLSLAIAARRGLSPHQVWEHAQQLPGGLPVLTGVSTAEQGAGLDRLWRPVGVALSRVRDADVIADCGRIGVDGPLYDLLAEASFVVLVMRASLGEGHLEQILDNLIANALDAVPAGGHIRVSAQPGGQGALVAVADDGRGMSQAQQEAAFRRFASNTSGGTGLGLAIVHRLVTSNGGSAALSDTPGGGLTVTLDLPAAPDDQAAAVAESRAAIPYQT